jgi:hypothetical protein
MTTKPQNLSFAKSPRRRGPRNPRYGGKQLTKITANIQFKPNLLNTQINVTSVTLKIYEDDRPCGLAKEKPKQTQFNPIKSQLKAN